MNRRAFITLLGGAAAAPALLPPRTTRAQQKRIKRIGVLMLPAENDPQGRARVEAFEQGLEKLGWMVSGNLQIDYRWRMSDVERTRHLPAMRTSEATLNAPAGTVAAPGPIKRVGGHALVSRVVATSSNAARPAPAPHRNENKEQAESDVRRP